jgi:telomerase reverse transcriptase
MVPKAASFRPIMNLRRSLVRGQNGGMASINGMLRNLHAVLNYHHVFEQNKMGASVISHDEVYERFLSFKKTINPSRKLHFVKFDFKSCFDSIPHERLFDVIHRVIDREEYFIHRYEIASIVNGKTKVRFRRIAFPLGEIRSVPELQRSGKLPTTPSNLIIDKVVGQSVERGKLLRLLDDHVRRNIVKIDDQYYRQRLGIPQGSILSTLLCGFFYGALDQVHLSKFLMDTDSMLIRYVDDILFVTPHLELMEEFVWTAKEGFPNFGAVINWPKAESNFAHPLLPKPKASKIFNWVGLSIDTASLCIGGDYSRFFGGQIADTLSIDRISSPVETLSNYLRMYF